MNTGKQLRFFPTSFPDESLYSLIARYHRLSGNLDNRQSLLELFGKHTHVVTSHLPSSIDALVTVLPPAYEKNARALIDRHTLFPYYRPFLTERQISTGLASMQGNDAGGLKTLIGLVASQVGGGNVYRFCTDCNAHANHHYGQPYWHRAHQLPAVFVCQTHGAPLFEIDASWVELHRHCLFLPTTPEVIQHAKRIHIEDQQFDRLLSLAILSKQVLDTQHPSIPQEKLSRTYRGFASDLGLVDANGRLRTTELSSWIQRQTFGLPTTGEFQFIRSSDSGTPHWAFKLLRKSRASIHPLKHILLLNCLNRDFESLVTNAQYDVGIAKAARKASSMPIPFCINAQTLAFMLVEKQYSLSRCAQLLGQSVATLRIEASRLRLPIVTKPKTLTEAKLAVLCEALKSTTPLKILAQFHKVSLTSLYRILRIYPRLELDRAQLIFEQERGIRRKRFLCGVKKSFARNLSDYGWLHKYDRRWLTQAVVESPKKTVTPAARVDWGKRDKEFAKAVKMHSKLIFEQEKPVKVSKALLGRKMQNLAILEMHMNKLPLTSVALSESIETTEQFQCRRLRWAAQELRSQHQSIPAWLLLRKAGIRPPASGDVLSLLNILSHQQNQS